MLLIPQSGFICSIIRFRYVDGLTQTDDFFWNAVNIAIWSTIETGVSIVAACLATLRPLFKYLVCRSTSTSSVMSCFKQISRSFRSGSGAHSSPNASALPQSIPHSRNAKYPPKLPHVVTAQDSDTASFFEYVAQPDGNILLSARRTGLERASADTILGHPRQSMHVFPWPIERDTKQDKAQQRQTIQSPVSLRRNQSTDDIVLVRPLSEPISPQAYTHIPKGI